MVINNELIGFTRTLPVSRVGQKILTSEIAQGRYLAKLAQTPAEVESALRLRYEVFNVELSAAPNHKTSLGLDFDEYDAGCKHLIVIERLTNKTIGTYRINSIESAKDASNFYAYNEFSLEDLPPEVLRRSLEVAEPASPANTATQKFYFCYSKHFCIT